MEQQNKTKRDIVKNVTIVFLIIMLLLMFFSNTIMNRTLPVVTAQTATSGTIKEYVKDSGIVQVSEKYEVIPEETRVVGSVLKKVGDKVEKGDVIYSLEDNESEELIKARSELQTLEFEYEKLLITSELDESYLKETLTVEKAREDLAAAQKLYDAYGTDEYFALKHATEYSKIKIAEDEIEILKENAQDKYTDLSTAEVQNLLDNYTTALSDLDKDEFYLLPDDWKKQMTEAQVKSDENSTESLKAKKEALLTQINSVDGTLLELPTEYYELLKPYKDKVDETKKLADNSKTEYETYNASLTTTDYSSQITSKKVELIAAQNEYDNAMNTYLSTNSVEVDTDDSGAIKITPSSSAQTALSTANSAISKIQQLNEELSALYVKENELKSQTALINSKKNNYNNALKKYNDAVNEYDKQKNKVRDELIAKYNDLKDALVVAESQADQTKSEAATAKQKYTQLKADCKAFLKSEISILTAEKDYRSKELELETSKLTLEATVADEKAKLEEDLITKKQALASAQADITITKTKDDKTVRTSDVDIKMKEAAIEDKKDEVKRLEEKSFGANVVAPVSGVISSLTLTAGQKTTSGTACAIIDIVDKGYLVSFSVKTEQAKKLVVGSIGEVVNARGDIKAVLTAIKNDTNNPQTNKILEYTVTGEDITVGTSLTISNGTKTKSFDCIVPAKAIHESSNRKFVYVLESKGGAFGSKYIVTEREVTVDISDGTNTAIVSGLSSSEFVVVMSSDSLKNGQQVKPADSST